MHSAWMRWASLAMSFLSFILAIVIDTSVSLPYFFSSFSDRLKRRRQSTTGPPIWRHIYRCNNIMAVGCTNYRCIHIDDKLSLLKQRPKPHERLRHTRLLVVLRDDSKLSNHTFATIHFSLHQQYTTFFSWCTRGRKPYNPLCCAVQRLLSAARRFGFMFCPRWP